MTRMYQRWCSTTPILRGPNSTSRCYKFLRILNNGPDDIKNCLDSIPAFWFDTLLRRFLNVYCDALDIQEIQIYWTRLRAMALDKFNVLEQRTKAKKSEIESLRDGVSAKSSSIIACCRMLIMMVSSCSTRLPSAKHSRPDVKTRTFWSSPSWRSSTCHYLLLQWVTPGIHRVLETQYAK